MHDEFRNALFRKRIPINAELFKMFRLVKSPSDEITLSNCAAVNVKDHEEVLKSSK